MNPFPLEHEVWWLVRRVVGPIPLQIWFLRRSIARVDKGIADTKRAVEANQSALDQIAEIVRRY